MLYLSQNYVISIRYHIQRHPSDTCTLANTSNTSMSTFIDNRHFVGSCYWEFQAKLWVDGGCLH